MWVHMLHWSIFRVDHKISNRTYKFFPLLQLRNACISLVVMKVCMNTCQSLLVSGVAWHESRIRLFDKNFWELSLVMNNNCCTYEEQSMIIEMCFLFKCPNLMKLMKVRSWNIRPIQWHRQPHILVQCVGFRAQLILKMGIESSFVRL